MSGVATGSNRASTGRKRAPRGEGDKLRIEILDATETLMVRSGDADLVSIRAIADAVGVTAPSIYKHFTDKEKLVNAVCERRFNELNAAFDSADSVADPVERLQELGRAYGRFALEHPEHYRVLMMTKSSRQKLQGDATEGQKAFGRLVDAVRACQLEDRIRDGDPAAIAVVLWSGVHGLVSLLITSPGFPWPEDAATLLERVLDSQISSLLGND